MKKFFAIALLGLTAFNAVPQYTFAADAATVRTLARNEQVDALFALLQDGAVISEATLRPAGLQGKTQEQVRDFIVKLSTALRTVEGDEAKKAIIRAILTKQAEPSFMARHPLFITAVVSGLAYLIADLTVIGERGKFDVFEVANQKSAWMQNKWYGNPGTTADFSDPTNNGAIINKSSSSIEQPDIDTDKQMAILTNNTHPANKTQLFDQTECASANNSIGIGNFTGIGENVYDGLPDDTKAEDPAEEEIFFTYYKNKFNRNLTYAVAAFLGLIAVIRNVVKI